MNSIQKGRRIYEWWFTVRLYGEEIVQLTANAPTATEAWEKHLIWTLREEGIPDNQIEVDVSNIICGPCVGRVGYKCNRGRK